DAPVWESWFALAGVKCRVNPVASFNDAGLMLQAAEQDLGLALARELLVADALRDGRLMRLSPVALSKDQAYALWFAYPTGLRDWPPLRALRKWLLDELERSERWLRERDAGPAAPKKRPRAASR
ncbi:MAG: LysR family transcriptional regulator, partial [Rhizobiales bacterium]|nr:LysR family transcriptional regulator [Rhizobacter sp.]